MYKSCRWTPNKDALINMKKCFQHLKNVYTYVNIYEKHYISIFLKQDNLFLKILYSFQRNLNAFKIQRTKQ